ncbi:hypothetical protein V502_03720, partial [Pseudogymnoascus sp. VKM F-4520 (FW-2644)]
MSHSTAENRRVFLAYRSLFSGDNANLRQAKKIRKLLKEHSSSFGALIKDFGSPKTVDILKALLESRVFESDIQAKIAFPELFQTTPSRSVLRAAFENEAARSEAEALEDLVSGGRINEYDEDADMEELPKKTLPLPNSIVPKVPIQVELKVPSLRPASIPYSVQHLILTTTQSLLEECCFNFAVKWAPTMVETKGWDCAEAVELTMWTKTLVKLCEKLPADAVFNDSGIPLGTVFSSTDSLRHSAVHRLSTSAQGIQKMVQSAVRLAMTLGDNTRAASLELVEAGLDRRIKDMKLNKNFLENRLDGQLQMIREQREELNRKETEAVSAMFREDVENMILTGSILETSVREAFSLHNRESGLKMENGTLSVPDKTNGGSVEHVGESSEGVDSGDELRTSGRPFFHDGDVLHFAALPNLPLVSPELNTALLPPALLSIPLTGSTAATPLSEGASESDLSSHMEYKSFGNIFFLSTFQITMQPTTGVGNNLAPDVVDTVRKLNAAGYTNHLEPGKMLPDDFNIGQSPNFQTMMKPVMKNIDSTRLAMKDETASIQLNNIRVALKGILDGRMEETVGHMLDAFNKFKVNLGLTFTNEFTTHMALDGHTYQAIDPETIVKNNPGSREAINYNSLATKVDKGASHFNAIQATQSFIIRVNDDPKPTSLINSRAPLATRICRESRSVALLAGATEPYDDDFQRSDTPEWEAMNDIRDLWVTPPTDVLHLNYYGVYDGWYHWSGSPVRFLVWLARRHHMRMSIVASLLVGFDDTEGAEYRFEFDKNFELLAEDGGPYLTTLCVVSLHVGLETALRKEGGMLFGRLGEERVKLIKVGDRAALQAYYNLWAAGPVEDREPAQFFDLAVSRHESEWLPRVAQWRQRLLITWVKHCWAKAKEAGELGGIQDHQGVWRALRKDEGRIIRKGDSGPFSHYMRPGPGLGIAYMRIQVPNEEHP